MPPVDDPIRQQYLARLRTGEGIKEFGLNYFRQKGSDPYLNPFAREALSRAQSSLPLLTDIYNVKDTDLEGRLGDYFSGAWNPSGSSILSERDRLGGLEGSIFATGDSDVDQARWKAATLLGRADLGKTWANAYGNIEEKRADEFNTMTAQKAATGNPWEGYFSGWRQGLPQMRGLMDPNAIGGGGAAPAPPAVSQPPATTTPPATTPAPIAPLTPPPAQPPTPPAGPGPQYGTPPAATPPAQPPAPIIPGRPAGNNAPLATNPSGGVYHITGGTAAQLRDFFFKNRSPTGHPDAPGQSSFQIGPFFYQAPRDTTRTFRDANGNGRYMGSGYNKMIERADLLLQQKVATDWYDAMTKAIAWIMSKGSGFGFSRIA
jgi:hypothetical protein